jgi:type IV secretion system protein VirD4
MNKKIAALISKPQILKSPLGRFLHWLIMTIILEIIGFIPEIIWAEMIIKTGLWTYNTKGSGDIGDILNNIFTSLWQLYVIGAVFIGLGLSKSAKHYFNTQQRVTARNTNKYINAEEKALKYNSSQVFGDARYAILSEAYRMGLQGNGILFGRHYNGFVSKPPDVEGHTLVIGAPGTGKTSAVAMPTLFMWPGAVLAIDIKGELSRTTANQRSKYGSVYIFDPDHGGHGYDPIALCGTIDGAQDLSRTLIPLPKDSRDPFWIQAAQSLLAAVAYEGAKSGRKICDVAEYLCITPIAEIVQHCKESDIREVRLLASTTYDMGDKTLSSVVAEIKTRLVTLASDNSIRIATSTSDWSPLSLEYGATVYLRVSEHMLAQYKDLWTVIISQVIRYLSQRPERHNPPILLLLDELPRLGELKDFSSALATLRSRNVHILGLIQSMAQLDDIYGATTRKVIADNCRFKLVLSAGDPETQKYFSDLAGQRTLMLQSVSKQTTKLFGHNITSSEQKTELIRPEQFARLLNPILFAPGMYPLQLDLIPWYTIFKA